MAPEWIEPTYDDTDEHDRWLDNRREWEREARADYAAAHDTIIERPETVERGEQ